MVLAPDEHQAAIYNDDLKDNLKPGAALAFAHGLNVHFGLIEPPADIDVIMIAPKVPGHTVRSEYVRGGGVPCLIAVDEDASGHAHDIALAYRSEEHTSELASLMRISYPGFCLKTKTHHPETRASPHRKEQD